MIDSLATAWGRAIGRYSIAVVKRARVEMSWAEALSPEPCIWVCFHESNMIAMALHTTLFGRRAVGIVPDGAIGHAMAGWFNALAIDAVRVPAGSEARQGLKTLTRALKSGRDVLLAVDGPSGPRRQAKPGALWLAAAATAPVRPFGAAARFAIRLPRWDRLLVPVPGARIVARIGPQCRFDTGRRDAAALNRLRKVIAEANACAEGMLERPSANLQNETTSWR